MKHHIEKKHNIATDLFADILTKIKLNKNKTRYLNYVKLCTDGIIIATGIALYRGADFDLFTIIGIFFGGLMIFGGIVTLLQRW